MEDWAVRNEAELSKLEPVFAARIRQFLQQLEAGGNPALIVQGLRTWAEQDALYAQGRTTPGNIVTNAKGGQSQHCYGLAVDLCPAVSPTSESLDWNINHPVWKKMLALGPSFHLAEGAKWHDFKDNPHFYPVEIPETYETLLDIYGNGGIPAVWKWFEGLAGQPVPSLVTTVQFDPAFQYSIINEGANGDITPEPNGGWAKYGINSIVYPNVNLQTLTLSQAEDIFKADYWDKHGVGQLSSQQVATKLFDTGINIGMETAIKMLQEVLYFPESEQDGVLGPETAKVINKVVVSTFLASFVTAQEAYYRTRAAEKGAGYPLQGLLNRAVKLPPPDTP